MQQSALMQSAQTKSKRTQKTLIQKIVLNRAFFPFLIPGLIVMIINQYMPMFGVFLAFKKFNYRDGIFGSPWCGLKNFEFLFARKYTYLILTHTIVYNLVFIFAGAVAAVAVAIALNEVKRSQANKFFQTSIIMPSFISIILVSYVVFSMLDMQSGVINVYLLKPLGFKPIDWYNEPKYWPFILTAVNLWKGVGIGSVFYTSAICGIDDSLYESAVIDGASKRQQIRYITLPFLTPMISIMTLFSLGGIIRADFGLFYQVTMNRQVLYPTTDVLDTYVYRALMSVGDIGMSTAAGFFQSAAGFIMVVAVNLMVKKIDDSYSIF